jgi:hypothetical protein
MPKNREHKIARPVAFFAKGSQFYGAELRPSAALAISIAHRIYVDMARVGVGGAPAYIKYGLLIDCLQHASVDGGIVDYLEIGSQFGQSALVMALAGEGHVYCIDPMEDVKLVENRTSTDDGGYGLFSDGYHSHYGERMLFDRNLKTFEVEDKVTLFQAFSNPWPLPDDVRVAVTYIDGDHSEASAIWDFEHAAPITSHYIMMDDYLSESGVTKAVTKLVASQEDFLLVYADYRVAIFARRELKDHDWEVGII